jgi:hypothetical protein
MKKSFVLSKELFELLEDFCKKNQSELRNILLASFAILLHRIEDQTEVGIATPQDSRSSNQQHWQITFSKALSVKQLLDDVQNSAVVDKTSSIDSYRVFSPLILCPRQIPILLIVFGSASRMWSMEKFKGIFNAREVFFRKVSSNF